jgi:hypothetical protein
MHQHTSPFPSLHQLDTRSAKVCSSGIASLAPHVARAAQPGKPVVQDAAKFYEPNVSFDPVIQLQRSHLFRDAQNELVVLASQRCLACDTFWDLVQSS